VRTAGLQTQTKAKLTRAFWLWQQFLCSIRFGPPLTSSWTISNQINGPGFSSPSYMPYRYVKPSSTAIETAHPLASARVRDTIESLSVTLTEHDWADPTMNAQDKTHRLLRLQFSAYKRLDPAVKHQQALTIQFILRLHAHTLTPVDRTLGPLLILAFFFATRS